MTSISYVFRVSHNTVSNNSRNMRSNMDHLKRRGFFQHSETNWQIISEDFNKDWNFSHCIGAIDGKHIVIQVRK